MKWIKALNLQQWADSIPAKVIFPALIADLIRATANRLLKLDFLMVIRDRLEVMTVYLKPRGWPPM